MFFGETICTLQTPKRRTDGETDTKWRTMGHSVDFSLADFDTVTLLTPVTEAATAWVAHHLPHNLIRWGGGIAIQTRNIELVVRDISESGLRVETY
jgi:hypothetical protein